jgi:hypothetical protein
VQCREWKQATGAEGGEVNSATFIVNDLLNSLCRPEEASSSCRDSEFPKALAKAKEAAVIRNDESDAFQIWCAETIDAVQRGFLAAFNSLKAGSYYNAWCQFERCEVNILSLNRHYPQTQEDPHRVVYIEQMISRWQALYPYTVFFSPELLKKRVECSICGVRVSPRSNCGHEKSNIYRGEMCYHKVIEVDILGISIVQNPVQRYSVAFLSTDKDGEPIDHYNYGNIKFVVERLDSAFHGWNSYLTTRVIAASEIAHLDSTQPCPCLSGKIFGECCTGKSEVTVPHLQIQFFVRPSKNLPANELLLGEAS